MFRHILWRCNQAAVSPDEKDSEMRVQPYAQLICCKQWADNELHEMVAGNIGRLDAEDASIVIRILDHFHVVDRIFQHHLQGSLHAFKAPRSEVMPDLEKLAEDTRATDAWYVSYVASLSARDFDQPVDFAFTSGRPVRMTRGEIVLHVCQHGAYHRGNAGILFQKQGIAPGRDAITDYLEAIA
jgi:uncharacterized damage-inducible protein DinB